MGWFYVSLVLFGTIKRQLTRCVQAQSCKLKFSEFICKGNVVEMIDTSNLFEGTKCFVCTKVKFFFERMAYNIFKLNGNMGMLKRSGYERGT